MKKFGIGILIAVSFLIIFGAIASMSDENPSVGLPPVSQELTEPAHGEGPTSAAPAVAPEGEVPEGMFLVGTDIPPGTYRTPGPKESVVPNCYWERLRDASGQFDAIIANGNPQGPTSVTVLAGEYFSSFGCLPWTLT